MSFSIYDLAITLYDALVFDNSAKSHAQLKLPQQRVMRIAGEQLRLKLAADIESERMLLPSGSLRKRKVLLVGCGANCCSPSPSGGNS